MKLAAELAARIVAFDFNALPDEAIVNAKRAILDTVAVALAGARMDSVRILEKVLGLKNDGPCVVFGAPLRTNTLDAALINGVAAHALDFDDVNITMGGHPSAPVIPALFALADSIGCSGADFLLAYIAGFETETALARCVNYHHYDKGWHPTATLGVFGSAAACARLLSLDEAKTAVALAISASFASGVKANFGSMTKPLHVGHCARNGLLAALLAREGYTANAAVFEHKQGFLNVFNGAGNYDVGALFDTWANPLNIVNPGAGVKLYPCCDSTHSAIDGILTLRRQHRLRSEQVERIDVRINALRMTHVNRPSPQSEADALFSVQYCTARALLDGKISLEHFKKEAFQAPEVCALMERIHGEAVSGPSLDSPGHYATELILSMKDGSSHHLRIDQPYGRSALDPLPEELMRAKYDDCTQSVLTPEVSATLFGLINRLEEIESMGELTALLGSPDAA